MAQIDDTRRSEAAFSPFELLIEKLRPTEPMPDFDEELEELPLHD